MKKNNNDEIANRISPNGTATRRDVLAGVSSLVLLGACGQLPSMPEAAATGGEVLDAMLRATSFMRQRCAVNGGYVWSYASDFARRWGAMEAYESMIWIQPPGTATMGHLFFDCYHASRQEYFYESSVEGRTGAHRGPASIRRLELHARLRRRRFDAPLVRHHRQERLALRGIPPLLRQRDLRRRRHGGSCTIPAARVPGATRPAIQSAARAGPPFRARQPVRQRRLAAALSLRRRRPASTRRPTTPGTSRSTPRSASRTSNSC